MNDLIAKLEAAEEGSRELDREIFASLGTHVLERRGRDKKAWWYRIGTDHAGYNRIDPDGVGYRSVPQYSRSLDDAFSLVPEGWGWHVHFELNPETGKWSGFGFVAEQKYGGLTRDGYAATAPLALCIAALKARQSIAPKKVKTHV